MKIGITSRPDLKKAVDLTEKMSTHLSELGEEILLPPELAEQLDEDGVPVEEMDIDSLITIGGDGTVLRNLQKLPDIPILGINMGGRGFLADVDPEEALTAVDKLIENELELIERERLKIEISGEPLADALNEGVIRLKEPSGVLTFRITIDGDEVEKNGGDGLIVSTPTGSTAYSMASGGPIMDPEVRAFLAVPLSTYRPRALPLVFPMDSKFDVELLEPDKKAYITVDGQITKEANQGDIVSFKKSDNCAKFYNWKGKFYEKMREKL